MENIKIFDFDKVDLSKGLYQNPYNYIIYEYDNGNMIHIKSPIKETFLTYNEKNQPIYRKDVYNDFAHEVYYRYDEKGNLILKKFKNSEIIYKYNEDGKLIFTVGKSGKKKYEYDKNGKLIFIKYCTSISDRIKIDDIFKQMFYDEKGNLIREEYLTGLVNEFQYNDKGKEIYYKNNNGIELWTYYDENDRAIYSKNNKGYEIWNKYDESGRKIMSAYKVS